MKEIIDIPVILSNAICDKGGTPAFSRQAMQISQDRKRKPLYRKAWIDFIPKLPTLPPDLFHNFYYFAGNAKIVDRNFWKVCASFIKNKWTEEKYPDWRLILERGRLIERITAYDSKLLPSYLWVVRSSRVLPSLGRWVLCDIHRNYNKEHALSEMKDILGNEVETFTEKLLLRLPGLLDEYGKKRISKELKVWQKHIPKAHAENMQKWFDIFSKVPVKRK